MTGRDLITASLRLLGAVASGESLGAAEATDGLSALNLLIDSWSNEGLMIPNQVREVFSLVAGQQTYTMGTGLNFNTSRPMEIQNALLQLSAVSPVIEIPMGILTKDQYVTVLMKTLQSTIPLYIYPDYQATSVNVNVWPVPSSATNSLVLYSAKALSELAILDTATSLAPGYDRAIKYNLAIELAPEYGLPVPEVVAMIAAESKASIKRTNSRPRFLKVDDSLRAKPAVWDWRTGGTT